MGVPRAGRDGPRLSDDSLESKLRLVVVGLKPD